MLPGDVIPAQKTHIQLGLAGFEHLPAAQEAIGLASPFQLKASITPLLIAPQLFGKQAVVKGCPSWIKATQENHPARNLPLGFVIFLLLYRSQLLHSALIQPVAATALILAAWMSAPFLPVQAAPLTSQPQKSATTSKPSLQGSQGNYTASVFVAASPQRAWQVLSNYGAMAGVMPDIKEAQVLSRNGASLMLRQTYQAPYTFGLRVNATLAVRENKPHQLSYSLISSEHIRQLKGSWTITPVAGGVLLRHTIQVDPRVPDFLRPLYFELSEANLLQSMAILKRLMEQGG